jgi:predicted ATPase
MIIKVASVIGRKFDITLLLHIFPVKLSQSELLSNIAELAKRELLTPLSVHNYSSFSSVVTQVTSISFRL